MTQCTVQTHPQPQTEQQQAPQLPQSEHGLLSSCTQQGSSSSKTKVMHDYHDYSHVTENGQLMKEFYEANASSLSPHKGEQNFPVKLHYMLSELEADGLDYIVSWQPHGRCFLVHDQARFVEEILPLWFRQSKFASFQRQLNLYGFKRLTSGRDKGGYYHECFLRGKRFLAYRIERIKIKGTGARKPGSPETEPNFYLTPFLPHVSPESRGNASSQTTSNGAAATAAESSSNPAVSKNFSTSASTAVGKFTTAASLTQSAATSTAIGSLGGSILSNGFNSNNATSIALQRYLYSMSMGDSNMNPRNFASHLSSCQTGLQGHSGSLLEPQSVNIASGLLAARSNQLRSLQEICNNNHMAPPPSTTSLQSASSAIVAAILQQREAASAAGPQPSSVTSAGSNNNEPPVTISSFTTPAPLISTAVNASSSLLNDWLFSIQGSAPSRY